MDKGTETNFQPSIEPQTPPPGEAMPSPAGPSPEEPIELNKLFPQTQRDLDSLFSDPTMKKLLRDVVKTRRKNDRFLKGIAQNHLPPERELEDDE